MRARYRYGCALLTATLLTAAALSAGQDDPPSEQQEGEILGGSAAFDLVQQATETVWIQAGVPLFERPDAGSQRLTVVDALTELEVLERSGDWRKVHYGGRIGWIRPDLPWKDRRIEVHTALDPLAVTTPGVDAELLGHLELAKRLLGTFRQAGRLGPYSLLTDVRDAELLAAMANIAARLDSAYEERYHLPVASPGGQTVALFAVEEAYRRFERGTTDSPRKNRQGHTIGGLASLYVGDQRETDIRSSLVHEITHLINRRALGPEPPAWIEEGIANDLAFCQVDRAGRLRPGTLGGSNTIVGTPSDLHSIFSGGLASLSRLLEARRRRQGTPLERLVEMSHDEFMASERRLLHYIESVFLIRFMLDGSKTERADGFRRYLDEVAAGRQPTADELGTLLGSTWPEIETGFDAWLRVQSVRLLR